MSAQLQATLEHERLSVLSIRRDLLTAGAYPLTDAESPLGTLRDDISTELSSITDVLWELSLEKEHQQYAVIEQWFRAYVHQILSDPQQNREEWSAVFDDAIEAIALNAATFVAACAPRELLLQRKASADAIAAYRLREDLRFQERGKEPKYILNDACYAACAPDDTVALQNIVREESARLLLYPKGLKRSALCAIVTDYVRTSLTTAVEVHRT